MCTTTALKHKDIISNISPLFTSIPELCTPAILNLLEPPFDYTLSGSLMVKLGPAPSKLLLTATLHTLSIPLRWPTHNLPVMLILFIQPTTTIYIPSIPPRWPICNYHELLIPVPQPTPSKLVPSIPVSWPIATQLPPSIPVPWPTGARDSRLEKYPISGLTTLTILYLFQRNSMPSHSHDRIPL